MSCQIRFGRRIRDALCLASRRTSAWITQTLNARLHPEDHAVRDPAIKRALETQGDYTTEYRVLLPDGTLRLDRLPWPLHERRRSKGHPSPGRLDECDRTKAGSGSAPGELGDAWASGVHREDL